MKKLRIALLICGALAPASGTASSPGPATFYVIAHAGPGDPYWSVQSRAAQEAGQRLGVRVIFSAPDRPGDIAKQVELLNAAISAQPAGIATTIPEPQAFSAAVQRAAKMGIPLVAFDTREQKRDFHQLPYVAYIGMDEVEAGRRVAARAIDELSLKAGETAVIVNHEPGVSGLEQRTHGILEALRKRGIKGRALDVGANPSRAIAVIQSYLQANAGTRMIFTLGPLGYTAAGKVIQDGKLQGHVHLAGFDVDPVGLDLIQKGVMDFTIDAQPYVQSFMAVTQLFLAAKYRTIPADIDTGVGFFDLKNVERVRPIILAGYQ